MRGRLTFFLLLSLLAAFPLQAAPVGKERAMELARTFFQYDRTQSPRRMEVREVTLTPQTKSAAEPAFYVFERQGGGFVIVSADDRCKPVLGYSFTNPFADPSSMPEGLRFWLEDYQEQVEQIRAENLPASPAALLAWASAETRTKAGSDGFEPAWKLETPAWGQGEPFNNLAPVVDGKRGLAGCVPLAMSMICRYYSYPVQGTGTLPGYNYTSDEGTTQSVEGFDLGHPYEWDKIRMDYSGDYTPEEAAAVARLVYDCGVMVQAKFDVSTSSNTGNMIRQAIEHLGFDAGAVFENRGFYSDEVWTVKLKEELQTNPVLYSARREGDYGHTFLLDGYDERDYFSINWGWKGSSNGYFALSAFIASPNRAYVFKHAACFGLRPDAGGTGTSYLYLTSGTATSGTTYTGLEPLVDKIVPGESFTMKVGGLANGGNTPFSGYFILALVDAGDNIKDFVCGSQYYDVTNPRSWRGYTSISCLLSIYPREGDRIKLFYCSEDEIADKPVPWKPVRWDRTEETVGEIVVTDDQTLADVTSLSYNRTINLLTIKTKDGVDWKLGGGSTVPSDAVRYAGLTLTIDESLLPKGTYTLTLVRDKDKVELRLKMGKK
ncbi:MAG: C10 family peptidase [Bacteroidales bacterium]|nr:C10 family peptidase [Bacteroidales bacterium]